jgi:hypothetical protein
VCVRLRNCRTTASTLVVCAAALPHIHASMGSKTNWVRTDGFIDDSVRWENGNFDLNVDGSLRSCLSSAVPENRHR